MKKIIALSAIAFLSTSAFASSDMEAKFEALMKRMEAMEKTQAAKIETLTAKIVELEKVKTSPAATQSEDIVTLQKQMAKVEKKQAKNTKKISSVNKMAAKDNIKFGLDFRNTYEMLDYKNNETGETASNNSLLTSRLYLNMSAAPMNGLMFKGKLAIYSTWGSHLYVEDAPLKSWSGSSKASDTVMRVKEAYFVYSNAMGEQPYSLSIGRRPASNGYLANYRENEPTSGSPLAHITNMEVDALMLKLDWDRFVTGAYTKFVYGRAHTGDMQTVYGDNSAARFPYAVDEYGPGYEDDNVDFFVTLGDAYNDGQYQLMYQWAHIFNTKGLNVDENNAWIAAGKPATGMDKGLKGAAGVADLAALSLKVDGIGDEISDFLDETTAFASVAYTNYNAKSGNTIIGSNDGGSKSGSSIWLGVIIPDGFTEAGKFGFEYNHGSQYWTPMTWAEDTSIGSKIAVRGDAYEAYWNFNMFGVKYLPSQIRYTYVQHDYTPNINCAGWIPSVKADIVAQNLRLAVSYRY